MRARICVRRAGSIAPRCSASEPRQRQQHEEAARDDPYAEILRIRAARKKGIGLSLGAMAASVAVAVGSGVVSPPPPPPLPPLSPEFALAAAASVAAASAAAKLALGDRLHVEFEGPRPFVEFLPSFDDAGAGDGGGRGGGGDVAGESDSNGQTPPSWRSSRRPDGRPWLVVRDVGDGRGKGVYVVAAGSEPFDGEGESGSGSGSGSGSRSGSGSGSRSRGPLPRGAFLGCYEGDLLDEESFWARYPGGIGDYCIGCGAGWCLDGAPVAERLRNEETQFRYSPCLINHSSKRHNVTRITRRNQRLVELYASRDIAPGEELLLDYGRRYWLGREAEEKE